MTKTRIAPQVNGCALAASRISRRRHLEGGELSEVDELTQAGLEVGRMPQLMFMPAELLARQRTVYAGDGQSKRRNLSAVHTASFTQAVGTDRIRAS
jgi:hypothetical protein